MFCFIDGWILVILDWILDCFVVLIFMAARTWKIMLIWTDVMSSLVLIHVRLTDESNLLLPLTLHQPSYT